VSIERSIMTKNDLVRLDIKANLGSVVVSAFSENGGRFTGLLPPDEVRALGRICFEEAAVAEIDHLLYRLMKDLLDLDEDVISDFIIEFRKAREE
jgi:hypothetical protein